MKRFAVIPAYEPDEKLIRLAAEARDAGFDVLVVDDGSGPACEDIFCATARFATVLADETNHGKGHALKRAYAHILQRIRLGGRAAYTDIAVVVLDCDGQHTVRDALRLCDAAMREPEALHLGSRRQSKDSPLRSRLGNAITRGVFRLFSGAKIYDTQTGMRACSSRMLPLLLDIPGERYEYEMNTLLHFAQKGIPMRELPIETIYLNDNKGSHFRAVRDSWIIYRDILRHAAATRIAAFAQFIKFSGSSLASFAVDYLLYSLLMLVGGMIPVAANVAARIVSACVNFSLNRRFVFRRTSSAGGAGSECNPPDAARRRVQGPHEVLRQALQYAALAAFILAANTALLWALTQAGMNAFLAKLLTEATLFALSYIVQKQWIFRREPSATERRVIPMKSFWKRARLGIVAGLALGAFTTYAMLDVFVIPHSYAQVEASAVASAFADTGTTDGSTDPATDSASDGSTAAASSSGGSTDGNASISDDSGTHSARSSSGRPGKPGRGKKPSGSADDASGGARPGDRSDSSASTSDDAASSGGGASTSDNTGSSSASTEKTSSGSTVSLKTDRVNDTTIYTATVDLSAATDLLTAFADDTYGRNIKDTTSSIASDNNALLAINGDFYGARNSGYVIRNGQLYRDTSSGSEDLVIYKDGSCEIINEDEVTAEELLERGAWQVLSFGPALVADGEVAVSEGEEVGKAMASNPRTAIGIIDEDTIVFVVSDGRTDESEGLSLSELAGYMQSLGVKTAYNLDGGGSSTMVYDGEVVNNPTTGGNTIKERSVSDIVYIAA